MFQNLSIIFNLSCILALHSPYHCRLLFQTVSYLSVAQKDKGQANHHPKSDVPSDIKADLNTSVNISSLVSLGTHSRSLYFLYNVTLVSIRYEKY